jgi:hypothetical protein
MQEGTTSRAMVADRPYGGFYDFYSVSPEYFAYHHVSLNRSHSYLLHAHYMTHLFHLHWSNYINIMNSSKNKPHYTIFCVLLLTPSMSDILLITFSSKSPKSTLFRQCNKSHFTPIKNKATFDLLIDKTFHCKWHFTCTESQNKDLFS